MTNAEINKARRINREYTNQMESKKIMKIIISSEFPYGKGEEGECENKDYLIHAEQVNNLCFVSQALIDSVKEYLNKQLTK